MVLRSIQIGVLILLSTLLMLDQHEVEADASLNRDLFGKPSLEEAASAYVSGTLEPLMHYAFASPSGE